MHWHRTKTSLSEESKLQNRAYCMLPCSQKNIYIYICQYFQKEAVDKLFQNLLPEQMGEENEWTRTGVGVRFLGVISLAILLLLTVKDITSPRIPC